MMIVCLKGRTDTCVGVLRRTNIWRHSLAPRLPSPLRSLQARLRRSRIPARPTLADLMMLTQLRHDKLWYATRVENWQLAAYEFHQFETTIDRIVKLYPMVSSVAQANLIYEKTDPAMAQLRSAITDKNRSRFEAAYGQMTSACNECHLAAGVSFIRVQVPTHLRSATKTSNRRDDRARHIGGVLLRSEYARRASQTQFHGIEVVSGLHPARLPIRKMRDA